MSANLPIRLMAEKHQGEWVTFRTAQGPKRGILERVDGQRALVKFPYQEAPMHLLIGEGHDILPASDTKHEPTDFDFGHVAYYAPGGVGYGPGVAAPYGAGWGFGGWWWIWIPIFFLALAVFLW